MEQTATNQISVRALLRALLVIVVAGSSIAQIPITTVHTHTDSDLACCTIDPLNDPLNQTAASPHSMTEPKMHSPMNMTACDMPLSPTTPRASQNNDNHCATNQGDSCTCYTLNLQGLEGSPLLDHRLFTETSRYHTLSLAALTVELSPQSPPPRFL